MADNQRLARAGRGSEQEGPGRTEPDPRLDYAAPELESAPGELMGTLLGTAAQGCSPIDQDLSCNSTS